MWGGGILNVVAIVIIRVAVYRTYRYERLEKRDWWRGGESSYLSDNRFGHAWTFSVGIRASERLGQPNIIEVHGQDTQPFRGVEGEGDCASPPSPQLKSLCQMTVAAHV